MQPVSYNQGHFRKATIYNYISRLPEQLTVDPSHKYETIVPHRHYLQTSHESDTSACNIIGIHICGLKDERGDHIAPPRNRLCEFRRTIGARIYLLLLTISLKALILASFVDSIVIPSQSERPNSIDHSL